MKSKIDFSLFNKFFLIKTINKLKFAKKKKKFKNFYFE